MNWQYIFDKLIFFWHKTILSQGALRLVTGEEIFFKTETGIIKKAEGILSYPPFMVFAKFNFRKEVKTHRQQTIVRVIHLNRQHLW
jgi:hypothetical protein